MIELCAEDRISGSMFRVPFEIFLNIFFGRVFSKLKVFRDCTRTCVIAQCAVPRQPTLSCLFYMNKRTSGFATTTTELEKACTLFIEINHCILTRWLSQPSEAIKKPRLNDLNRSALKGYKLAVTRSASTKTSRNALTILQKACIQLVNASS